MNDDELPSACCKAGFCRPDWVVDKGVLRDSNGHEFDPLRSNADMVQLAVKLGIAHTTRPHQGCVRAYMRGKPERGPVAYFRDFAGNEEAAERWAVAKAAHLHANGLI
jgi:hypothetical protein